MTATAEIKLALKRKYPLPEYALLLEVSNGTGGKLSNYADALAFGLYPSRGLTRQGFEIKVSRGDWLKELKNPAKAESIAQYCDHWWIVSSPGIVKEGELPTTWGLMEFDGKKFKVITKAPKLNVIEPTREFLAAVMRRIGEQDVDVTRLAMAAEVDRLAEAKASSATAMARLAEQQLGALRAKVAQVKEETGIDLNTWRPAQDIVKRLKIAEQLAGADIGFAMGNLIDSLDQLRVQCEKIQNEHAYACNTPYSSLSKITQQKRT